MPIYQSNPVTLTIRPAAPPPRDFGTGSETGTFVDGIWTPGRDASGLINAVSWALVPSNPNAWIEVASTRLDALDAAVKAAVPGWRDRGGEGWDGVTDDWNGMAVDLRSGRERAYLAVGGGHFGSSNDGVYSLDLRKMQWDVELMPSDPATWVDSYNGQSTGSFTNYPAAAAYYQAKPDNPEGVWFDEFFDGAFPTDNQRSSRRPTSRHTYGSVVFVPSLGGAGKLLMGCRRYWEYDIETRRWARPKFPFDSQTTYSGAKGYGGENMQAWFFEGRYYMACTQNDVSSQTWSCLPGGVDWKWHGGLPVGGYSAFHTAQEQLGNVLWTAMFHDNNPPYNQNDVPRIMRRTDLSTGQIQSFPIKLGPTFTGKTYFDNGSWDTSGMTYVPPIGKWLLLTRNRQDGERWAWLNPADWTLDLASMTGLPPGLQEFRTENKVKWFEQFGAVLWINKASQNVRLLKP